MKCHGVGEGPIIPICSQEAEFQALELENS